MYKEILIATTNSGKLMEIRYLFSLNNKLKEISIISLNDLKKVDSPTETGNTFEENAKIKADFYFTQFNMPVIVEDSGFCVSQLDGFPGVKSAEMAINGSFENAIKRIYEMLNGMPSSCCFKSVVIFKTHDREILCEGVVEGNISRRPLGKNGFGFDSCFIPNGMTKTFAEMELEEKSLFSHRKTALNNLMKKI